jgi:hypothetical protein
MWQNDDFHELAPERDPEVRRLPAANEKYIP